MGAKRLLWITLYTDECLLFAQNLAEHASGEEMLNTYSNKYCSLLGVGLWTSAPRILQNYSKHTPRHIA